MLVPCQKCRKGVGSHRMYKVNRKLCGGAACPVMGAVFKTVVTARERRQVGSTPTRLRQNHFGFGILDFGFARLEMNEDEFKRRTKDVALRTIRLVRALPNDDIARTIGKQLVRSGTSVGANYRAACRAKSNPDIINKLAIVEEEADESMFWMEVLVESEIIRESKTKNLYNEFNEIVAMVVSSIKTLKAKDASNPKSKIRNPK
jgi:four helix bundle protein